ncbi:unnamed protein product, partial [marine sediment metagenome]
GELIKAPNRFVGGYVDTANINHPGNYPFPTDMTFRKYADHKADKTIEFFDPDAVQKGDTIYLSDWYIPWFITEVHPKIKHPYILISCDTDGRHPESGRWDYSEKNNWPPSVETMRTLLYDPKIAAWFCKNMVISRHPKIVQIPIGQNIIYFGLLPEHDYLLELAKQSSLHKKYLLYMNMQLTTNPVRLLIAKLFQDRPFCVSRTGGLPRPQFLEELSQSKFTIASPGYGPDIVRFWEAIVVNCIPIVKHCDLDDLYSDL